jgi:pantoate--beta-alanine ligase
MSDLPREFTDPSQLQEWMAAARGAGMRIGFVPTMGALHEGHLSLVRAARRHCGLVVMSIFVNPLQFAEGEDLSRYPRDLVRDRALAADAGVDALFVPAVQTLYPPGSETRVVPGATADRWEGASRPGHFTGVLTVVAKLFNIVQPDAAYFGQKDWQQAVLVRRMARDLDFPLELVVEPTVREADGLALSSRNVYLGAGERAQALGLSAALAAAHASFVAGERDAARISERIESVFGMYPGLMAEYIAVVEPETLAPVARADARTVVALAARVNGTRLIDNIVLGQGLRAGSA